ncbi:MAG: DUF2062 domain-containing protein [Geminicoccaceae bacterium]
MVFASRRRPPLLQRVRGWLWPHIGWSRAGRYLLMRLQRLPGTPHGIAAGLAAGIAVSFTPLLGLHFLLAFGVAWLAGGNMLAAALGTIVGNPWTFPLIFAAGYELGCRILGMTPSAMALLADLSWDTLIDNAWALFWPMLVGSLPLALFVGLASYLLLVRVVAAFQERRRQRREAALAARRPPGG